LVTGRPAFTISDPMASILYGITLFGERVRSGRWLVMEPGGFVLIFYGSVRLSQSRPIRTRTETETV
jgi:hypothetical protein